MTFVWGDCIMEEMTNGTIMEAFDTFLTLRNQGMSEAESFLLASEIIVDEVVNSMFQQGIDEFEISSMSGSEDDFDLFEDGEEFTEGYAEAVEDIYEMIKTYRQVFGKKDEK